jgi:nitroreductase
VIDSKVKEKLMIMTKTTASRRKFVRGGMALGGGLLSLSALPSAGAAPADDAIANETLRTIHSLRSIHGDFSDRRVRDADVKTILEATVRAANASNTQSYSIVVSRDPEKIQKLTTYRAGCLFLYCADHTRLIDTAKHLGYEYYADNIETFIGSGTNTILAAQTAVIAAKSLGIDSLLTNGIHRGDMERIWTILDLPQKSCFPLIALLLGYPRSEPSYQRGRLKGSGVIHYERFHHLQKNELDEIVRQYDDKTLHLGTEDWDTTGHKHYLDWFYKEWARGGSKPTTNEGQMFRRLKKSGYVDVQPV